VHVQDFSLLRKCTSALTARNQSADSASNSKSTPMSAETAMNQCFSKKLYNIITTAQNVLSAQLAAMSCQ